MPDREWLGFRMETAYGDRHAVPPPGDVVEFLRWAGEARRIAARSRGGTR
ncbi:MAG: hypothetical protein ACYCXY_04620 [Acidimicrobiales bacterium]